MYPFLPALDAAPRPRRLVRLAPLRRQPLCWLLLLAGAGLMVAAGNLAEYQRMVAGAPSERLYLRAGFDSLETGPAGPFHWTQPRAELVFPHTGPGPITVHLTLFDSAPASRAFALALDGRPIYAGQTRPGGTPWVLDVPATAASETPLLTLSTAPWRPPGDRRVLGVALTAVAVDAPAAAGRAREAVGMFLVAVWALLIAAIWRGVEPVVVAGAGCVVLGFWGALLAYGDLWLLGAAPAILALGLAAAVLIAWLPMRHPARAAPFWGTLALTALLLLLTWGRFSTGDAEGMFQVTAGLAEDGLPWQHSDHAWIKLGLGQPLAGLPLYWLGRAWAGLAHASTAQLTRFCVSLLNQGVVPATALVLFLGARRRYGAHAGLALAATWLLATPAVPYARLAFAEPLSGLLVLSAFLLLWAPLAPRGDPTIRLSLAGVCLGLAVLVKPANAIYIPVPALYLLWTLRDLGCGRAARGLALFGLGLLPGLLLTGAYDALRYGSPVVFGYEQEGFTTPLPLGLYGLLFSPGKGLIWFAPPVLLTPWALARTWRHGPALVRAEALCIAGQAALVLGFHALWSSWEGNIAWGPRLILPLVPLLLWPLGALVPPARARSAWWGLAVAGFLVAIPGALIDQFYYFDLNGVYGAGTAAEQQMLFSPLWSPILAQWRFLLAGAREAVLRPSLASMGLPAGWDTAVPVALVGVALLGLILALDRPAHRAARQSVYLRPPTVAAVVPDEEGGIAAVIVKKGLVFQKEVTIPVERIAAVLPAIADGAAPGIIRISTTAAEVDALAPTGAETLAPAAEAATAPRMPSTGPLSAMATSG